MCLATPLIVTSLEESPVTWVILLQVWKSHQSHGLYPEQQNVIQWQHHWLWQVWNHHQLHMSWTAECYVTWNTLLTCEYCWFCTFCTTLRNAMFCVLAILKLWYVFFLKDCWFCVCWCVWFSIWSERQAHHTRAHTHTHMHTHPFSWIRIHPTKHLSVQSQEFDIMQFYYKHS